MPLVPFAATQVGTQKLPKHPTVENRAEKHG
jgi:hypothetical protein